MNHFKNLNKLDLWIATDRFSSNGKLYCSSFIYYKKPTKDIKTQIQNIVYETFSSENTFAKILFTKSLNLVGDNKARKLYILKKRHKKSIRTFWLAILGYKKYVLTNALPIKEEFSISLDNEENIFALYIDTYTCESGWIGNSEEFCEACSNYPYCINIYKKHHFQFKKVYLYFINNKERVYL